jgi:hypothetical protein
MIAYMILAATVAEPPQMKATKSKENRPTSSQLSAPMIVIASAVLSIAIFITPSHIIMPRHTDPILLS